jgi:hypothetical protein
MSGMEHLEFYGQRCNKCGEKITISSKLPLICHLCYDDYDMGRFVEILPGSPEPKRETNGEEE